MAGFDLDRFEQCIDALIRLNEGLQDENASLRAHQALLLAERAALIEKNHQACLRLEAMLSRLRAMEEHL